jgi:hypothetical protein
LGPGPYMSTESLRPGDIVVLSGAAEVDESGPSAADAAWAAEYAAEWERFGMTVESFAQRFSVPVRVRISAVYGF